mgnify:FL=1
MIVYPNAKINLGLNILRKRKNGYHEISSVFYPVKDLFDILEIVPSTVFNFSSSGINIPGEYNICIKAYNLLKLDFDINPVKIHLHKKIPIGGGLGGGSADGAFTLLALNHIFNLDLSLKELELYALKLGADCPFFIENKPKYVTGIGDKMIPLDLDLSSFDLRFFFPNIHISTKEAYSRIKSNISEIDLISLINQPIEQWQGKIVNDFENITFSKYPQIKAMKKQLYDEGSIYASMSGSGSVLYGFFSKV